MYTAVVLVCLYSEPLVCEAVVSPVFYLTGKYCLQDRVNAEESLGSTTQGVISYQCIDWGKPV